MLWLALEPHVPHRSSGDVYERLWQVGDAIGSIGVLAVVSIAAYLVGSLLVSAQAAIATRHSADEWVRVGITVGGLDSLFKLVSPYPRDDPFVRRDSWATAKLRWLTAKLNLPQSTRVTARLDQLVDTELAREYQHLHRNIEDAKHRGVDIGLRFESNAGWDTLTVRIKHPPQGAIEVTAPLFSPQRDVLGAHALLESRLLETSETTGNTVARLNAEAELRQALTTPLAVLSIVFAVAASPLFLFALLVPALLWVQGVSLRRDAERELVDALRALSRVELERVTPTFARYRTRAEELSEALRVAPTSTE